LEFPLPADLFARQLCAFHDAGAGPAAKQNKLLRGFRTKNKQFRAGDLVRETSNPFQSPGLERERPKHVGHYPGYRLRITQGSNPD
jgi:hypothetical protein